MSELFAVKILEKTPVTGPIRDTIGLDGHFKEYLEKVAKSSKLGLKAGKALKPAAAWPKIIDALKALPAADAGKVLPEPRKHPAYHWPFDLQAWIRETLLHLSHPEKFPAPDGGVCVRFHATEVHPDAAMPTEKDLLPRTFALAFRVLAIYDAKKNPLLEKFGLDKVSRDFERGFVEGLFWDARMKDRKKSGAHAEADFLVWCRESLVSHVKPGDAFETAAYG